jgi:hypothetical protein
MSSLNLIKQINQNLDRIDKIDAQNFRIRMLMRHYKPKNKDDFTIPCLETLIDLNNKAIEPFRKKLRWLLVQLNALTNKKKARIVNWQELIIRIKETCNIADIVSQYVQLKKSGKAYSGLCPFHKERHPSFFVFPDTQSYHCFGCQAHGDVFSFLQNIEGISFKQAVQVLSRYLGIKI